MSVTVATRETGITVPVSWLLSTYNDAMMSTEVDLKSYIYIF